jgi:hypothetical protein
MSVFNDDDSDKLDLELLSKAPLDTVLLDLLMYQCEDMFSRVLKLLELRYTQVKSLIEASAQVNIISEAIPIYEHIQDLQHELHQLRSYIESYETWGVDNGYSPIDWATAEWVNLAWGRLQRFCGERPQRELLRKFSLHATLRRALEIDFTHYETWPTAQQETTPHPINAHDHSHSKDGPPVELLVATSGMERHTFKKESLLREVVKRAVAVFISYVSHHQENQEAAFQYIDQFVLMMREKKYVGMAIDRLIIEIFRDNSKLCATSEVVLRNLLFTMFADELSRSGRDPMGLEFFEIMSVRNNGAPISDNQQWALQALVANKAKGIWFETDTEGLGLPHSNEYDIRLVVLLSRLAQSNIETTAQLQGLVPFNLLLPLILNSLWSPNDQSLSFWLGTHSTPDSLNYQAALVKFFEIVYLDTVLPDSTLCYDEHLWMFLEFACEYVEQTASTAPLYLPLIRCFVGFLGLIAGYFNTEAHDAEAWQALDCRLSSLAHTVFNRQSRQQGSITPNRRLTRLERFVFVVNALTPGPKQDDSRVGAKTVQAEWDDFVTALSRNDRILSMQANEIAKLVQVYESCHQRTDPRNPDYVDDMRKYLELVPESHKGGQRRHGHRVSVGGLLASGGRNFSTTHENGLWDYKMDKLEAKEFIQRMENDPRDAKVTTSALFERMHGCVESSLTVISPASSSQMSFLLSTLILYMEKYKVHNRQFYEDGSHLIEREERNVAQKGAKIHPAAEEEEKRNSVNEKGSSEGSNRMSGMRGSLSFIENMMNFSVDEDDEDENDSDIDSDMVVFIDPATGDTMTMHRSDYRRRRLLAGLESVQCLTCMLLLVVIGVCLNVFQTSLPPDDSVRSTLEDVDYVIFGVFLLEFVARGWCHIKHPCVFWQDYFTMIDFTAIVLDVVVYSLGVGSYTRSIRFLRLARLFR